MPAIIRASRISARRTCGWRGMSLTKPSPEPLADLLVLPTHLIDGLALGRPQIPLKWPQFVLAIEACRPPCLSDDIVFVGAHDTPYFTGRQPPNLPRA